MLRLILVLLVFAGPLRAGGTAGEFDYYVMALSWSPNWCAREGAERGSPQCAPGAGFGWVLHGLWPQYERGWPDYCSTDHRNPSRADTAAQAGLFGSAGAAWHQWDKHGVCSGLSAADYYALSAEAYDRVTRPQVFRELDDPVRLPATVVEEAFLRDNRGLSADGITVTCRSGSIQEARICLTRDLAFRDCGADVRRDCTLDDALFAPMR
ncbi:MAG: ribonuclease T2 [Salibaculum sp.]|jgi:ribonuclease T2|uniref:ribonuclease T2 n=1 Tax=Roseovarius halophilus (ex Wu et al. 2025) TaxID=3376060 RepID=UPI0028702700|nr:ribonuclease T2 [Salibaculum sp.]MDR9481291.1 ribonuclease T2 [Salibaculum sp.]